MPHAYAGRILRADLAEERLSTKEFPQDFCRQYFGGERFVAHRC